MNAELFIKEVFGLIRLASQDHEISPIEKARILNATLAASRSLSTTQERLKEQVLSSEEAYNEIMLQIGDLVITEILK